MPEVKVTHLYREVTSVYIVAQEQISRLCWVSSNLEQFHQIVLGPKSAVIETTRLLSHILSMDVTADSDRRVHLEQVGLGSQ